MPFRMEFRRCNGLLLDESPGQATVEYALVLLGFLAVGLALYELWGFVHQGGFAQVVLESLSHRMTRGALDVLCY